MQLVWFQFDIFAKNLVWCIVGRKHCPPSFYPQIRFTQFRDLFPLKNLTLMSTKRKTSVSFRCGRVDILYSRWNNHSLCSGDCNQRSSIPHPKNWVLFLIAIEIKNRDKKSGMNQVISMDVLSIGKFVNVSYMAKILTRGKL